MESMSKQKARLTVLKLRAKLLGLSVDASSGDKVHYAWWYFVSTAEPYHWCVAAICKNLDELDRFITLKEVDRRREIPEKEAGRAH